MKFKFITAVSAVLLSLFTLAQTAPNHAYAITSERKGSVEWTEVKLIDLGTGNVIRNIFENHHQQYNVYEGRTAREIKLRNSNGVIADHNKLPFSGLSAACAYDKKMNRLYYAPIFINELRYIDLNSAVPKIFIFDNEHFSNAQDLDAEANQITRMSIAADGNGYALTNDGGHLIRFTTGAKPVITDLGALSDDGGNEELKISDANTSWGGDMVADASGHLFIVSAKNHVFKINIETRLAAYIGKVTGLPEGFTTNGTVVDEKGQIVLSSANYITGYYKVDPAGWKAELIPGTDEVFNTSDLANENLLFQTDLRKDQGLHESAAKISVFPNPIKTDVFRVSFDNKEYGDYNIQLVDIAGRMISDKPVSVSGSGQVSEIRINPFLTKGMYVVKVLNHKSKQVYTRKIIVE